MSSPIHHAKDLDVALMYAPPWARDQSRPEPVPPAAPAIEWPPRRRRTGISGRAAADDKFSGDVAIIELQRRLKLEPDRVPAPVVEDEQTAGSVALRTCAVIGVAALVAWIVVSWPSLSSWSGLRQDGNEAVLAGFQPTLISVTPAPPAKQEDRVPDAAAVRLVVHDEQARANEPDRSRPQGNPVAAAIIPPVATPRPTVPPVSAPQTAPTPSDSNALRLDNEEIDTMVKRGQDFLKNGDLASARLLLKRAADAGNANAALALGATFDPLVIQRLGAVGAEPDTARAREWYQKAAELGSDVASQQLNKLAQVRQ
jgi:hypothetical protein